MRPLVVMGPIPTMTRRRRTSATTTPLPALSILPRNLLAQQVLDLVEAAYRKRFMRLTMTWNRHSPASCPCLLLPTRAFRRIRPPASTVAWMGKGKMLMMLMIMIMMMNKMRRRAMRRWYRWCLVVRDVISLCQWSHRTPVRLVPRVSAGGNARCVGGMASIILPHHPPLRGHRQRLAVVVWPTLMIGRQFQRPGAMPSSEPALTHSLFRMPVRTAC
mmetsp:Transcript_33581/g.73654  ORF Transcript_33581/g.73654 Transcript_33581/m.73654 type:complete len:217 (+) Transcript_33581:817-1467(+)